MRAHLDRHPHLVADSVITPGQPPILITRPFEVPVATGQGPDLDAKVVRAILYGDIHYPNQDEAALTILESITAEYQPDVLVCIGDLLDCYKISDFEKDPRNRVRLQDEINLARTHLHRMAQLAPKARRVLLEGNHEDRLRRQMWDAHEKQREMFLLDDVTSALEWPKLLHLDEIGWEFYPYHGPGQSQLDLLPKFIVKHGNFVRKWSGSSGKAEHERLGKSGASGHCHRLGMFFHRDHNGNHGWLETGCLCQLDPDWMPYPDWQQGFWTLAFDQETGAFGGEFVYIHHGRAVWRGEVHQA
jgi:predicted phosphodiesterase